MPNPYPDAPDYDQAECERVERGSSPTARSEKRWRDRFDDDYPVNGGKLSLSLVFLIKKALNEGRHELFYIKQLN